MSIKNQIYEKSLNKKIRKKEKQAQMTRIIIDHSLYFLKICSTLLRKRKNYWTFLKKNLKYIITFLSHIFDRRREV